MEPSQRGVIVRRKLRDPRVPDQGSGARRVMPLGQEQAMKPKDFKRWRKTLGLSQKAAAEALGLKRRVVQYYEKGERDGKDVGIPKAVRLACYALTEGVSDYHGPRDSERPTESPARSLTNGGSGHETEHYESPSAELVGHRPEDVNGEANGKKPGKGKKEKNKDKSRDKGKNKDRGKGETTAASHEKH